jgi:hypothetical protein
MQRTDTFASLYLIPNNKSKIASCWFLFYCPLLWYKLQKSATAKWNKRFAPDKQSATFPRRISRPCRPLRDRAPPPGCLATRCPELSSASRIQLAHASIHGEEAALFCPQYFRWRPGGGVSPRIYLRSCLGGLQSVLLALDMAHVVGLAGEWWNPRSCAI